MKNHSKPHRFFVAVAYFLCAGCLAFFAPGVNAQTIVSAWYEQPVSRYGHYAVGKPHEYAQISLRTDAGHAYSWQLPGREVFEDIQPRLVKFSAAGPTEILAIVSAPGIGARMLVLGVVDGRVQITAQSPPIGTNNRWLNPVGVADLDGDGQAELAAVITPHIGGTLKIYERKGDELIERAALTGFSNHQYGSAELGLSVVAHVSGKAYLVVPSNARTALRVIAWRAGQLVPIGRCELPAPLAGPLRQSGPSSLTALLADSGKMTTAALDLLGCPGFRP